MSCTNHVYPTPRGWIGEETLGCQRNKSSSGCANDCKISIGRGFMENLSFSHNHRHQVPIHKLSSCSTWKVLLEQNQKLQPLGLCSRPLFQASDTQTFIFHPWPTNISLLMQQWHKRTAFVIPRIQGKGHRKFLKVLELLEVMPTQHPGLRSTHRRSKIDSSKTA